MCLLEGHVAGLDVCDGGADARDRALGRVVSVSLRGGATRCAIDDRSRAAAVRESRRDSLDIRLAVVAAFARAAVLAGATLTPVAPLRRAGARRTARRDAADTAADRALSVRRIPGRLVRCTKAGLGTAWSGCERLKVQHDGEQERVEAQVAKRRGAMDGPVRCQACVGGREGGAEEPRPPEAEPVPMQGVLRPRTQRLQAGGSAARKLSAIESLVVLLRGEHAHPSAKKAGSFRMT